MALSTLVPILVVIGIASSALWVYFDEVAQSRRGTPVACSFGAFRVDSPGAWFGACLFLWLIFFPLYLTGRKR